MHVIGTAGHVDHGKSTLIEALTGIDPDRLAEEKERAMTIDLGFAWMQMEIDGEKEEVGIVDVPGHRDFIENMLAGVGGIDLALLVVAADEGVMPQTREHLAILDLLEIPGGVVALTKIDLVKERDWLELVTLDLMDTLAGTVLEGAEIVQVSGRTGKGLPALRTALNEQLQHTTPRADLGQPRLPIDRVFSLSGFGTIVTGTLTGGNLRVGDQVEVQPPGHKGRIRGLQSHKQKREVARAGGRVAVNVSGIDTDQIRRGDVLAAPQLTQGTTLLDAQYRHLPEAGVPLKHNVEVKLFVGSAEVMARTRVLGTRQILPGETGWLQLALREPLAVLRGDHFILRRPSPGATLGGGQVLDPHPGRQHRRFKVHVLERLETLAEGTPAELILQQLQRRQPLPQEELWTVANLEPEAARAAWEELVEKNRVLVRGGYAVTDSFWTQTLDRMEAILREYHDQHPLRLGIPREELRNRLALSMPVFNTLLEDAVVEDRIRDGGKIIRLYNHEVEFTATQRNAIEALMRNLEDAGVNSPSVKECRTKVGDEVYEALVELGRLRQLSEDVVYRRQEYEQIVARIVEFIGRNDSTTAAEVRDLLDTSRKYTIALLEHLDQEQITRRVGDRRVLISA